MIRWWGSTTRATAAGRMLGVGMTLTMLLAGCGGQDGTGQAAPAEPVIRLGWSTPGQEPFYVMQHHPEVAKNLGAAYRVDWVQGGSGQAARSLATGVVDGAAMATLSAATAIAAGADLVLAGALIEERDPNRPLTWLVRADAGIEEPADLAGATVGTGGVGGFADLVGDHVIQTQGGLEADQDYRKAQIPYPQMRDALLSGRIATGPFPPPFLQQTMATGETEPLFTARDAQDQLTATVLVWQRAFVQEHPAAVEAFMADWVAVHRWIADPANRDQVIEATSQATEIPVELLDQYLLTEQDGYRPVNGALDVDTLQRTWDFFAESGAIPQGLRVDDHIIPGLLPPPE